MTDELTQAGGKHAKIIHHDSVVEDWILHAQEMGWEHSSDPTLFVTYTKADSKWLGVLDKWCGPELRNVICRSTGQPYKLDYYSGSDGTADGRPYPPTLAEQMWRCQGAIVVVSQDYFQSPICYSIELPFLAWRQRMHGIPLWALHVGKTTSGTSLVKIPAIGGEWPAWYLNEATADNHPGFNTGLPRDRGEMLIADLPDGQRDHRMKGFAEGVAKTIRERDAPRTAQLRFGDTGRQLTAFPPIPDVKVGEFPPIDVFEGRKEQLTTLTEAAVGGGVAVAGMDEIGGQGKTTLGLKFIKELKDSNRSRFEGYFSFTFNGDTGGDKEQAFAEALTRFLTEQLSEPPPGPQEIQLRWLWSVLRRRAVFLFLDGMETIQAPLSSHAVGALQNGTVLNLLTRLCQPGVRSSSFALLTSRLPFHDLYRFRGRFLPVALGGLLPPEGAAALRQWEVEGSDVALEGYSRDLEGHPLGLRAFANSVTASSLNGSLDQPVSVAALVAQKAALSRPGTAESKVLRVIEYYRSVLTEVERTLLEIVASAPDGIREDWLRQILRERLPEVAREDEGAVLENSLSAPVLKGILQPYQERGQKSYTCHPVILQSFRPRESGLATPIAALHIADRPPEFVPRTLAEAKPYLRRIVTLASDGQFRQASNTLVRKLSSGDLLFQLGAERELFDCLMQFFGPDRREPCLAQLGTGWFNAMLPRMVDCCIDLNEWKWAEEFNALDKKYLRVEEDNDYRSNQAKQIAIEAEIGSIQTAYNHLVSLIRTGSKLEKIQLLPRLAEYERYRGRPNSALEWVRQWLQLHPQGLGELKEWLAEWNTILETLVRIGNRASYDGTARYLVALENAAPVDGALKPQQGWYFRYFALSLREPQTLSRADFEEMLDLSEKLGKVAERKGMKGGKNGWMQAIVEALNGLGRAGDAWDEAQLMLYDLDERSWRQMWLEAGIARADFLMGKAHVARELAVDAMNRARDRGMVLLASSIAELLLEIALEVPDPVLESEVRELLEACRVQHVGLFFPEPEMLPGEPGWDQSLSRLLIECVGPDEQETEGPTDVDRALILAAELNLPGAVTALQAMGASSIVSDPSGRTPLRRAVMAGSDEAVAQLLSRRGPIDLSEDPDQALIGDAIAAGRPEMLRRLLQGAKGLTPDMMTELLMAVAIAGSEDLLDVMIELGARPEQVDSRGRLIQVTAAAAGNRAFLERISGCVDLSIPDNNGMTPLMAAAAQGHLNVIDFLADSRVDPAPAVLNEMTAWEVAANTGQVLALLRLADRFALPLERERHLGHALVSAASKGWDLDILAGLKAGIRLSERDDRGWTALVAMARNEQIRSLTAILPKLSVGEVDLADSDGETALMAAAAKGNTAAVELLLKASASPGLSNAQGLTAFDLALASGQAETLALLLRHAGTYLSAGRVREALEAAIASGYSEKLSPLMHDDELGRLLARAVAVQVTGTPDEEPDDLVVSRIWAELSRSLRVTPDRELPQRHPREMTDHEVMSARCVLGDRTASSFGRLVKAPLPADVAVRLVDVLGSEAMFDHFDITRACGTALRFLPGHWLVLLPHKTEPIEVPLVLAEDTYVIADSVNEWLYGMMARGAPRATADLLLDYIHFFFTVIVGEMGAFFITHNVTEVLWNDKTNDAVKAEFASKAKQLTWIREEPDGRNELRGTVIFKDALFETSVIVGQNWAIELTNEEPLMEELPIEFGRRTELLVRY